MVTYNKEGNDGNASILDNWKTEISTVLQNADAKEKSS